MTWQYLLDTNILSDVIRRPDGPVRTKLSRLGPGLACTSIINAAELCYGAAKVQSDRLRQQVETVLFVVPPLRWYGRQMCALRRFALSWRTTVHRSVPTTSSSQRTPSPSISTLVTANVREFSRVPGLRVENWLD